MKHAKNSITGTSAGAPPALASPLQERLSSILDEYLTLLESNVPIDDERFLKSHSEFADELRPHLVNLRAMQGAVAETRQYHDTTKYEAPQRLGCYLLKREIGRGGQGIVYEAHDETLNRRVALKVLPFAALLNPKQIDRFNNEAQAAARLHHPNIVPVYAVGVDRGVHYYAMQYVEGAPLSVAIEQLRDTRSNAVRIPSTADAHQSKDLQSSGPSTATNATTRPAPCEPVARRSTAQPFSTRAVDSGGISSWVVSDAAARADYKIDKRHFEHVTRLGIEVANGLAHAHDLGIVHRDVKPSNLLLDEKGKAWIADFGLAHISNDESNMTGTGDVLGTIRYMSPEQAKGRNAFVDHRSDIYSLGVTLYEMLTLKPVFASSSREEFMSQIGMRPAVPLRRVNSAIPTDLENIIMRAIELDPVDRYESIAQVSDDLQRFLDGKPTLARRVSLSDRAFKWAKRRRRLVTSSALVLVAALIGLATATFMIAREQSRTAANYERAQSNFEAAREMVDRLGVETSEQLAAIPGTARVRSELLEKTQGYYDLLLKQSQDGSLLHDRGVTLTRSARISEQLGEFPTALARYREAAAALEVTIAQHPQDHRYQGELLNCWNNQAMLMAKIGQGNAAKALLRTAATRQQQLLHTSPSDAQFAQDLACSRANLAFLLERDGDLVASQTEYEAALQHYRAGQCNSAGGNDDKATRQFALVLHNLSALLATTDRDRALELCREAIRVQQRMLENNARSAELQSELAISFDRLASLVTMEGDHGSAEKAYGQAMELQRSLIEASPDDVGFQEDLAITLNHLGDLKRELADYRAANAAFEESALLLASMVEHSPHQAAFHSSLGAVLYNQGSVLLELEDASAAHAVWMQGLAHQQAAVQIAPTTDRFRTFLAQLRHSLNEAFPGRLQEIDCGNSEQAEGSDDESS